jgi:hypothetical protein
LVVSIGALVDAKLGAALHSKHCEESGADQTADGKGLHGTIITKLFSRTKSWMVMTSNKTAGEKNKCCNIYVLTSIFAPSNQQL